MFQLRYLDVSDSPKVPRQNCYIFHHCHCCYMFQHGHCQYCTCWKNRVASCIVPRRQSGIVTNHQPSAKIQYFDQYFYSSTAISEQNVASYVYMNVCFSSFGWASCFGKCISKQWLYCNDKIDCSVKSLYYLIINHCTGLNWSDWRFKRSLKLLFTDDQLHTSLTDEILMKNWPKSNNATDPGVIYLKRCLPFTVALFNLTMILVQMM